MQFARNPVDDTRIAFEDDGGGGEPTFVLGGFLDPISVVRRWPLAEALASLDREFRLVFVDHRGHGDSGRPHDEAAYAMALRVGDVLSVMDRLDVARGHVVGLSWGARLGFGIVERAPARVRSLVAVGQHPYALEGDGPLARVVGAALEQTRHRGIVALIEAFEAIAGRYPERVRDAYLQADAAALRAAWRAALSEGPVSERLAEWHTPCLVAVAEDDVDFFELARRAAEEIPTADFVAVARTDHLGMDTASADPILAAALRVLRRSP